MYMYSFYDNGTVQTNIQLVSKGSKAHNKMIIISEKWQYFSPLCVLQLEKLKVTSEHDSINGHCPLLLTGNTVFLIVYIISF